MTSERSTHAYYASRSAPRPSSWTVWPVAARMHRWWLACAGLALVGAVTAWSTARPAYGVAAAAAVALSAWRFFVPQLYEINSLGITVEVFRWRWRVPWKSIGGYEIGRQGVYLAARDDWLGRLRGIYLPWSDNRREVTALVEYYLGGARPAAVASKAGGSSVARVPPAADLPPEPSASGAGD